jgi:RNase P protein component
MKRRLREAVRLHLNLLKNPTDVVINPKRSVLQVEFGQIAGEIERAFTAVEKRSATMQVGAANPGPAKRAKMPLGANQGSSAQRVPGKKAKQR